MQKDHMEIILEDIRGKFDLVLEGHDALRNEIQEARRESNEKHDMTAFLIKALNKKIDDVDERLNRKIDDVERHLTVKIEDGDLKLDKKINSVYGKLSKKIDAVADDLKAHRADTESHKKGYGVSEA